MLGRFSRFHWTTVVSVMLLASVSAGTDAAPVVGTKTTAPVTTVTREQLDKIPTRRSVEDLLKTCPGGTIPTVTRKLAGDLTDASAAPLSCVQPSDVRMINVYTLHNKERALLGYQPLRWNPALEASATAYAQQLARTGQAVHSSREGRGVERENLNQGMLGWNTNQMMQNWLNEKSKFTPGVFPNVCVGDWTQCGHYSQMIWPTTTDLGCGLATGSGYQWLICRYSPGGNKDGKPVGQQAGLTANGPATQTKQQPTPCKWIDAKTGKVVASGPILNKYNDPSRPRPDIKAGHPEGIRPDFDDPNRAFDPVSGRNFFFDLATCQWKDSKTGKVVASGPILNKYNDPSRPRPDIEAGHPEGIRPDFDDPNRAFDPVSGRNFAKVPVAPTPTTDAKPSH